MLKTAEKTLKSDKQDVLMVRGGKFKKSGKKRNAKKGGNKASPTKQSGGTKSEKKKVSQPTSESECFYCKKKGHWKRDCLKLKEDEKNGTVVPSSGIFCYRLYTCKFNFLGIRYRLWLTLMFQFTGTKKK